MSSEFRAAKSRWTHTEKQKETRRPGRGKGKGEEKAAALPLEGLPGRSWFLALVRPSCVPAHGLGGYLVALRNQLVK